MARCLRQTPNGKNSWTHGATSFACANVRHWIASRNPRSTCQLTTSFTRPPILSIVYIEAARQHTEAHLALKAEVILKLHFGFTNPVRGHRFRLIRRASMEKSEKNLKRVRLAGQFAHHACIHANPKRKWDRIGGQVAGNTKGGKIQPET